MKKAILIIFITTLVSHTLYAQNGQPITIAQYDYQVDTAITNKTQQQSIHPSTISQALKWTANLADSLYLKIANANVSNWNTAFNKFAALYGFNIATGVLTATNNDGSTNTVSLDGRYALNSNTITINGNTQTLGSNSNFTVSSGGTYSAGYGIGISNNTISADTGKLNTIAAPGNTAYNSIQKQTNTTNNYALSGWNLSNGVYSSDGYTINCGGGYLFECYRKDTGDAAGHTFEVSNAGQIWGRYSRDNGKTWCTPYLVYDNPLYDDRNCNSGFFFNGKLVIFFSQLNAGVARLHNYALTSTDSGKTFGAPVDISSIITTNYVPYGTSIMADSGELLIPFYRSGVGAILQTTDGSTFTLKCTFADLSCSEFDIAYVGKDSIYAVLRNDSAYTTTRHLMVALSTNNGNSFPTPSLTNMGENTDTGSFIWNAAPIEHWDNVRKNLIVLATVRNQTIANRATPFSDHLDMYVNKLSDILTNPLGFTWKSRLPRPIPNPFNTYGYITGAWITDSDYVFQYTERTTFPCYCTPLSSQQNLMQNDIWQGAINYRAYRTTEQPASLNGLVSAYNSNTGSVEWRNPQGIGYDTARGISFIRRPHQGTLMLWVNGGTEDAGNNMPYQDSAGGYHWLHTPGGGKHIKSGTIGQSGTTLQWTYTDEFGGTPYSAAGLTNGMGMRYLSGMWQPVTVGNLGYGNSDALDTINTLHTTKIMPISNSHTVTVTADNGFYTFLQVTPGATQTLAGIQIFNDNSAANCQLSTIEPSLINIGHTGSGTAPTFVWQSDGTTVYSISPTTHVFALSQNITAPNMRTGGKIQQTLTSAATISFNVNSGANAALTIGTNVTLTFSGASAGDEGDFLITEDATGGRTITLPVGSIIEGGSGSTTVTLTATAGAKDKMHYYYDGTNYWWKIGYNYK